MAKKQTRKKKKEKKSVQVNVDSGGPAFFSDSATIFHNQRNFIFDFQQSTPRFTRLSDKDSQQSIYIRHNAIVMDPIMAKEFLRILQENISKYERKFGEISSVVTSKKSNLKRSDHTESYIG
ncbi:MAG: DUF3467 domain-containing protein [Candidatus Aenigmarchaeota archaeon]|nr:DUF3467 domain-containing protein [Candidatus Aenigmarchaeota archaeon]